MLSRLVTTLLPRNKCLSISRLQSPSVVILEPPQNKICHCFSTVYMSIPIYKIIPPHSYPQASQIAGSGKNKQTNKNPACQCRRHKRCGFHPWVRKIRWRRAWQPTPVFLPGESHGQRSLVGYTPRGRKESDTD